MPVCPACTRARVRILQAEGDFRRVVRQAVRHSTPRNLEQVDLFRERLDRYKRARDEHDAECTVLVHIARSA